MTKEEKDTPTEFKYSIWDTRTADAQPNFKVTSAAEPKQSDDTENTTVPDTL